jgi:hypothetical protein
MCTCGKSKAEHSAPAIEAGLLRIGKVKPLVAARSTEEMDAPRRNRSAEDRRKELENLRTDESYKVHFQAARAAVSAQVKSKFQGSGKLRARDGHIVLNPPSKHYQVTVTGAGNKVSALTKSPDADGQVDLSELLSGTYEMTVYTDTKPPIPIGPARRIEKLANKCVAPAIHMLDVTSVLSVFYLSDEPLKNELIKFDFVSSETGQRTTFEGRTDGDGTASTPLPAGTMTNLRLESASGKILVERSEPAIVPKPAEHVGADADAVKPLTIMMSDKCTTFAPIIEHMSTVVTKALVLGTQPRHRFPYLALSSTWGWVTRRVNSGGTICPCPWSGMLTARRSVLQSSQTSRYVGYR